MDNYLFLQILGNSDVLVDGQFGVSALKLNESSLEDVEVFAQEIEEEILADMNRINFHFIRKGRDKYKNSANVYFGIILTNQLAWIRSQQNYDDEAWSNIISSDGYWWRNLLAQWCQENNINYVPLHLNIDATVEKGAADWEGMSKLINQKLSDLVKIDNQKITLKFSPDENIKIDKIIVQHSSGTPALSSALYLWGIEQKLAKLNVDFVYISYQDSSYFEHQGSHWQWRLKVPQINQLLDIQDFSGVLQLIDDFKDKNIKKELRKLDRAVSLNITDLGLGLSPQEEIIERIAIALWSETAFRERGQWMHWYMRVAGAFELVLLCLIQKQGNGNYQWVKNTDYFENDNPLARTKKTDKSAKTYFQYKQNDKSYRFDLAIKKIVTELLTNGSSTMIINKKEISCQVNKVSNSLEWQQFTKFYCDDGWKLSSKNNQSFIYLRNDLYHSLQGDIIDQILDKQTEVLGGVQDSQHPSQVAIDYLNYVIDLADLQAMVETRVNFYKNKLEFIKQIL